LTQFRAVHQDNRDPPGINVIILIVNFKQLIPLIQYIFMSFSRHGWKQVEQSGAFYAVERNNS